MPKGVAPLVVKQQPNRPRIKKLVGTCLVNANKVRCLRGHPLPVTARTGRRVCKRCKNIRRNEQRSRILESHAYVSSIHCRSCAAEYDRDARRRAMRRNYRAHKFIGPRHCRFCARDADRQRYRLVCAAIFPPHEFVDGRHCKDCNREESRRTKARRRARRLELAH